MKESQRQRKFARLVQRELGLIFQQDKKGILNQKMVSVVDVKISPDLSVARAYLGMMLIEDKEDILQKINEHKGEIRNMLGNQIGKQVRRVPEIIFFIDEVEENAQRIEDIMKNLHIPPAPEE